MRPNNANEPANNHQQTTMNNNLPSLRVNGQQSRQNHFSSKAAIFKKSPRLNNPPHISNLITSKFPYQAPINNQNNNILIKTPQIQSSSKIIKLPPMSNLSRGNIPAGVSQDVLDSDPDNRRVFEN